MDPIYFYHIRLDVYGVFYTKNNDRILIRWDDLGECEVSMAAICAGIKSGTIIEISKEEYLVQTIVEA